MSLIRKINKLRATPYLRVFFILILGLIFVGSMPSDKQPQLLVRIVDADTGAPTPVHVILTNVNTNTFYAPDEAIGVMYGFGWLNNGYSMAPDSSFFIEGSFTIQLDPGNYRITISKGIEYLEQTEEIHLGEGQKVSRTYRLERWINMQRKGWYSSDDHVHIRRSPRDNPYILRWFAGEGINVGVLLWFGDFWRTYSEQYAWGEQGSYREGDYLLVSGQEEPRTTEIGHSLSIGADAPVRYERDYYLYDRVFDRVRQLNGITGYAHQGVNRHAYRGMTLDVLRNKIDFLELVQFCAPPNPMHVLHYYHFLDLGYELTATGGSDFPWGNRGISHGYHRDERGRIGNGRFYTYTGSDFSFNRWKENVKAGHTFATSGPILELKVNDKLPGDEIDISRGSSVIIEAKAFGHHKQIPLRNMEIVGHGKVLKRVESHNEGQSSEHLTAIFSLTADHGIWIAARCSAAATQIAHTTPVYVTVEGDGFHNPETVDYYINLSEQYLQEIEQEINNPEERIDNVIRLHKEGLYDRIEKARVILRELKEKY